MILLTAGEMIILLTAREMMILLTAREMMILLTALPEVRDLSDRLTFTFTCMKV